jgi:hypothetical protein
MRSLLWLALLLLATPVRLVAADGPDFFTSKVRPILASHCFKCHGPDDKTRKARLRLDVREETLKPARSRKRAIVPGQPAASELIARIFSEDETEVMPPPSTKLQLSKEQKEILKRWIADGATYSQHWAFVPPRRPVVPSVKQTAWPRNPLDRFVLARLEREGLKPSPQADRYTLVRRLYLDLIGMPPTPAEADAFLDDRRADAYERLVEQLLASPAYGERWARRWLDLARYADTNGYEKDRPRSIWPWRDWVIAALNADLPFDRFTIEQLAGDMLSPRAQIATGFHRNTMLNEEGGIDPLEFRFHAMTDRVATTGTVWLGLTIGCAQCHSHKYDPISQKEYYQLFAFLNNADEPQIDVPDRTADERRRQIEAEIARLEGELADKFPGGRDALEKRFSEWRRTEVGRTVRWHILQPNKVKGSLPLLTIEKDHSIFVTGDQSKSDTYDLWFESDLKNLTALRLEVLPDNRLPRHGPGRIYYEGPSGDFFLSELSLFASEKKVVLKEASQSFANGNNTAQKVIDGDPQTGWSIQGGQGKAHSAVFRFEKPLASAGSLHLRMLFERYYAAGLGRFRIAVTTDTRPATARDIAPDVEALLLQEWDRLSADQQGKVRQAFLRTTPELKKDRQPILKLQNQMPTVATTLILAERPRENPRPTFIHHRGEFLQPTERVDTAVPAALHEFPEGAPRDRLNFARWLVSPANPLVGRVTVNRDWAVFFGQGIVPTVQDFGLQGELPSHPELLDWLAIEWIEQGWSMKHLHRLIVTSATYRQSSRVSPHLLARDPKNRLLTRGPRVRLEAEMVRDLVLRSSGLLAMKLGGPSVYPPQPKEVTTEGAYGQLQWTVSDGLDRHRRGLYTFMKRTTPFALFSTFDGPSGEYCLAKREVSNTPLQALTMLNDQTILEASQELSRWLVEDNRTVEERTKMLFRRILTRPATADEVKLLVAFFHAQKERFEKKELDPGTVAGKGGAAVVERAAWTALARVLFNLDETITKG